MADLVFPVHPVSQGFIQGRAATAFLSVTQLPKIGRFGRDLRVGSVEMNGVITDRVVLKTGPGSEIPFVDARVWLLRYADGFKAWEGWSDAAGYYTATGLETGVAYVCMAVDRSGGHKSVAAGPVIAV